MLLWAPIIELDIYEPLPILTSYMIMLFCISTDEPIVVLSPIAVEGKITAFGPISQFFPMLTGPTM